MNYINTFEQYRMSEDWAGHLARGSRGGLDYALPMGTPILAPCDGRLEDRYNNGNGFGNYIRFHHGDGFIDEYLHLKDGGFVAEGYYSQGQVIGYSGSTGNSTGPHVHWHLIDPNGVRVNPLDYLSNASIPNTKDKNKMNMCHIPQPNGSLKFLLFNDSFYLEFVGQEAANAFATQIGGNSAGVSQSFFDLVKAQVAKNQSK
jgi:hypothetical protein